MSRAVAQAVQTIEDKDGVGISRLFDALINQGRIARLPVLHSILPPPPSPDELAVMAQRLRDSQRRIEMDVRLPLHPKSSLSRAG